MKLRNRFAYARGKWYTVRVKKVLSEVPLKYCVKLLLFALCALETVYLTGCGMAPAEAVMTETTVTAMENSPVTEYEVPFYTPGLMVDCEGYSCFGRKEVFFQGNRLPGEFRILEKGTGQVVYTGNFVDVTYNEKVGMYTGSADFSSLQEEGNYYLECDESGESHPFVIQKGMYETFFGDLYRQIAADCEEDKLTPEEVITLLEIYEWYPGAFSDEDGDKVPDVLNSLKRWVEFREAKDEGERNTSAGQGENTANAMLYSAILARLSYLYQKFDAGYAAECLKMATELFDRTEGEAQKSVERFLALTELYRVAGGKKYGEAILAYADFSPQGEEQKEALFIYAVMTYMSTHRSSNMDMCEVWMNSLMDEAQEIAKDYTGILDHFAEKLPEQAELLKYAMKVSCANYIMNNHQYTRVGEDFLHYLMGRNGKSENMYAGEEHRTEYLLLLAPMAVNEKKTEQKGE